MANDKKYRWANPYEWFEHYLDSLTTPTQLRRVINLISGKLDSDDIQDLYQDDMDADGYFEAEGKENREDEEGEEGYLHE